MDNAASDISLKSSQKVIVSILFEIFDIRTKCNRDKEVHAPFLGQTERAK